MLNAYVAINLGMSKKSYWGFVDFVLKTCEINLEVLEYCQILSKKNIFFFEIGHNFARNPFILSFGG